MSPNRQRSQNVVSLPQNEQVIHDRTVTNDLPARQRALLMTMRQALIMALCGLEDYLELERSIERKSHRR